MPSPIAAVASLFGRPPANPFRDGRRVVFCHAQKTGGSSLRRALAEHVPARRLYPSPRTAVRRGLVGMLDSEASRYAVLTPQQRAEFWLIADHLSPRLFDDESERPLMVTIVREPVARAVSHLAHARRYWPVFAGRSLEELFDYPPLRAAIVDNVMVRFFSARTLEQATQQFTPRLVGAADVVGALERIEAMHAVGLTERFEESVRLIGAALGLPALTARRDNVARARDRDEAAAPALRARVAEAVRYDLEFYAAVKSSVDAKLDAAAIKTMRYDR